MWLDQVKQRAGETNQRERPDTAGDRRVVAFVDFLEGEAEKQGQAQHQRQPLREFDRRYGYLYHAVSRAQRLAVLCPERHAIVLVWLLFTLMLRSCAAGASPAGAPHRTHPRAHQMAAPRLVGVEHCHSLWRRRPQPWFSS